MTLRRDSLQLGLRVSGRAARNGVDGHHGLNRGTAATRNVLLPRRP